MKTNTKIIQTCLIALLVFVSTVAAQDLTGKMPPIIRTNGDAVVTAKPDRAQISLGIVTQAATSQAVTEQNSKQFEILLADLRKLLGAKADIRTINYSLTSLTPIYRYPPSPEPAITGYSVTNIVQITLDDLTQLGKVIDTAGAAGANQIQGLSFTVKNPQTSQAQALNEAAMNARKKAELLASTMGLRIVRILSITDTSPATFSGQYVQFAVGRGNGNANANFSSFSEPVAPKTIDIRATVVLTIEVSQ